MKYSEDLVAKFCEELKKVPNIKHVCKKLGIDRSTFYRWRIRHHFFEKAITDALYIGRESINDSAESVIINGVQNGDMKCATYWLSHNHERYIAVERVPYHQHLEKTDRIFLQEPTPENSEFDQLFKYHFMVQDMYGEKRANEKVRNIVEYFCHEDPELIDIYFATYAEYAKKRIEMTEKQLAARKDPP
jgi:hypothetical protein